MSERLLLPSAKPEPGPRPYLRFFFAVFGVCIVLYGAYDLVHRVEAYPLQIAAADIVASPSLTPSFLFAASPIVPMRLSIPSIGVNAAVESVGDTAAGAMATPKQFDDVGWYDLGAKPGESGNAVFAGHVNNALTKAGVFEHLFDLKQGDTIAVLDAKGDMLKFVVTDIEDYADNAPLQTIFSKNGPSGLVLITCAGEWDAHARSFDKRLVVYARLTSN